MYSSRSSHYKNLSYTAIPFVQSPWLHEYIELNTNFGTLAKSEFEKNLFKLMNNVVFDKTMKNVRNHSYFFEIIKKKEMNHLSKIQVPNCITSRYIYIYIWLFGKAQSVIKKSFEQSVIINLSSSHKWHSKSVNKFNYSKCGIFGAIQTKSTVYVEDFSSWVKSHYWDITEDCRYNSYYFQQTVRTNSFLFLFFFPCYFNFKVICHHQYSLFNHRRIILSTLPILSPNKLLKR